MMRLNSIISLITPTLPRPLPALPDRSRWIVDLGKNERKEGFPLAIIPRPPAVLAQAAGRCSPGASSAVP